MSINYCTIGAQSIDGFCGSQRAKVLARLIREAGHDVVVPPTPRPSGGGISIGPNLPSTSFRPGVLQPGQQPWRQQPYRPPQQDVDQNLPPREQPFITVRAEVLGMVGQETLEATARLHFVVVTDLEINSSPEITVNISEMEI